ncbi:putative cullin repeat-like-containing domain, exocyst complex component Exo84 [Rosa chinensis]|uniref:Putative cullin repeat-like-containing domain, exocyst complex component Exo84 n=1 Tax=Rosa chinensis TaxID=74649 RepID=A0A2P6Q754_ROSCH|nr:exocyst complex component EXO84C isoform X1 [Rosa chinensis]PRQ29999.1 putative cullin repeat-like-containing domain, exocyst complex component Exo84 [Rosa chinensis]
MESSEEEEDFPSLESITPQSKVDSLYQSHTEKGIRKLCCELLDLKDAVENLCGDVRTKYLAFLRISEEAVEMEHELVELRKHISSQGILVQDLMTGVFRELEGWNQSSSDVQKNSEIPELQDPLPTEADVHKIFLDKIDVLLAEHKVEEALEALDAEERNSPDLKSSADTSSIEGSTYRSVFLKRKALLEDQLVEITTQPFISFVELQKALMGLMKLGKGPLAHQLLLKFYGSRLQKRIEALFPSCSVCPKTYPATLSKLVFSIISSATQKSGLIFGDNPVYTNRVVQWAEWEIEYFVRSVKENAPSSETASALGAASICVQASLSYSSVLERQGLKLSKLILVLLRPFIEEVLELNFRRARKFVLDLVVADECMSFSPRFAPPLSAFTTSSEGVLVDSGIRFMCIIEDILEQLTPMIILHFGANILSRIGTLFDKYMDALIKALPESSDDDTLTELKEFVPFRAETDSEQLAILGVAFTIVDELLPNAVMTLWKQQSESVEPKSGPAENVMSSPSTSTEFKDWRRHLQHSFDKLRDHFCRQYVLSFIYSREGKTRLDAQIYLSENGDDLYWDSDPLPSLPFQALFAKLQQLATVAGDVLLGKEKIQKILLARLTETVLMWLSDEQEFWSVFENDTCPLQPFGLQQLILDMHFTVEIARFAGYPPRHVHQIASAIIARAIRAFSAKGIEPQTALPEDEWFVETAKSSINKLLLGTEGSETSEVDQDHINLHGHIVMDSEDDDDDDDSDSSLSSVESTESFASASMGELDSPRNFDD